ncbi:LD-carboxypeptidase [Danxiaibacter flavus]|uniref:LD-carboxypeptidase n=1 Tax=Danxiaibacter flavus TaxID=3049108 RepID=A0ABV3ZIB2_9BACT|nr:LD-carboxypeptidase [Chitinophagaceae bacterium DXS]
MQKLMKPVRLSPGDKIAAVSSSAGLAGALPYRYKTGKQQLENQFGLTVVEMKHTLKDLEWVKKNPKARAEDLMEAFADPSIKGIISTIGGDDSIRMLPYLDLNIISANPKVFVGYSDTTVSHLCCCKAGITSFYGPGIMANFAENQGIFPYVAEYFTKAVLSPDAIGEIKDSDVWTNEFLDWFNPDNQLIKRRLQKSDGRKLLQGSGVIKGRLFGGCIQTLITLNGTALWPGETGWDDSLLFLEVAETQLPRNIFEYFLRSLGTQEIWDKARGIIFGIPGGQKIEAEFLGYENALRKIIGDEYGRSDMPILSRMNFGHTDPVFTIPYGVEAEIDCERKSFTIIESGVVS